MKKLLSITGFTALLTLLRMSTGFLIGKVVAIYTGPTGLAMLGQIQSVVSILNGIINSPAGSGVVRYTAENIHEGFDACTPWWRASFQWILALLATVIPVVIVFSEKLSIWVFDNSSYYWLIIIACSVLPLSSANTLITSVINGQQKFKRYVTLGMISNIITTFVMISLIYFSNIKGALIAAAINSSVSGVVLIVSSINQPWFKIRYWIGQTTTEHKKKIGGYVLMAITSALTVPVSLIVIRNILVSSLGWEQVGQWQAVWKISEVYLAVITMALGTYYLPKLATLSGVDSILNEINSTVKVVMPIVLMMSLTVYLCRDIIIYILFTKEFTSSRDLFGAQLAGDVVKILSWLYAYPMLSRGATKWFVSTEIYFSLQFVILSYYFIDVYQIKGAPLAYLVNYSLYLVFIRLNFRKFAK